VHRLITEEIPNRVAADKAYRNARQNSDKQNARIAHDKALARVMTAVLKDDTTYDAAAAGASVLSWAHKPTAPCPVCSKKMRNHVQYQCLTWRDRPFGHWTQATEH
jgi:hypothetical protein